MYVRRYSRSEFGSEVIPVEAAEATARAAISRTLSQSQAVDADDVVTEMEAKVFAYADVESLYDYGGCVFFIALGRHGGDEGRTIIGVGYRSESSAAASIVILVEVRTRSLGS